MNSILQTQKRCFICKETGNLHRHHVFFGNPNRKLSEKYGLTVYLCLEHHEGDTGVHHDRATDLQLKQFAQKTAMDYYGWSIDEFRQIFGKNYLEV